ncbi:sensor histidine kinase [Alkalispirochaeta americana]|uniref:sensor histidine kinase n=1 Tax=Alkalispirochaeta americana TaxID=159291 RepID=UPI000970FADE|nr:histidine kinase dimerization/phosphoacceptor domain -containing protein [Alkalispirochaeta americana]
MATLRDTLKRNTRPPQGRYILILGLVILAGTWSITFWVIRDDYHLEISRGKDYARSVATVLEKHAAGTFSQIESSLLLLRENWESDISPEEMSSLLEIFVASRSNLFNLISVIDSSGEVVATDQSIFEPTFSGDRPFFLHHHQSTGRSPHLGEPTLGRLTGRWYLPVSLRLEDSRGTFAGVLLASVNPFYFSELFRDLQMERGSLIYLFDRQGTLYTGLQDGNELDLTRDLTRLSLNSDLPGLGRNPFSGVGASDLDQIQRIKHRRPVRDREIFVAVETDYALWMQRFYLRRNYYVGMQLIFSAAVALVILRLRHLLAAREAANLELDRFFSSAIDLLCIANTEGTLLRVNREWEKALGYPVEEIENRKFLDFIHPDDLAKTQATIEDLKTQGTVENFINRYQRKDGQYRHIEWRTRPHGDLLYAAARDITDRIETEQRLRAAEEQLRQQLAEKETLLGELNHRVKNNLSVVAGLLNLQAEEISSPEEAVAALAKSRDRIMAMSVVHQMLYSRKDCSSISMRDYIEELSHHLACAHSGQRVSLELDLEDLFARIETAIPLGIILNELITNAFKHAFADPHARATIRITLAAHPGFWRLTVSDNGPGFQDDARRSSSLGLTLVEMLMKQLKGTLTILTDEGSFFQLDIPETVVHES